MRQSRARAGRPRRTLDDRELDAWVERLCRLEGEERLAEYRQRAEQPGPKLGITHARIAGLESKIGAAIGAQQIPTSVRGRAARQAGLPFDPDRIERFDGLVVALRSAAPQSRRGLEPRSSPFAMQAFYEAYFSNYIEGITFTVGEAKAITYDGAEPAGRTADSQDVVGTYRIVADHDEMSRIATSPEEFLGLLQSRHATLMGGRPAIAGNARWRRIRRARSCSSTGHLWRERYGRVGVELPSRTRHGSAPST